MWDRLVQQGGVMAVFVLWLHLTPYFGSTRLADVRMEDGLVYLEKRRSEKAAEGTIERECAVLSAVLNLAVECEALDKNRLRRLPVPQYVKRERVAESWELQKIQQAASQEVWRVIILALQTGMRESKLIDIHEEWLVQRGDGLWLAPSPGRSSNKRVAKAVPRSMTLHVPRCDVICQESVVGSLAGGKTRTPSSIGGSKRLNGQGCMNSISMTCVIPLPHGCSKREWITS
jgi:hypothetical protein